MVLSPKLILSSFQILSNFAYSHSNPVSHHGWAHNIQDSFFTASSCHYHIQDFVLSNNKLSSIVIATESYNFSAFLQLLCLRVIFYWPVSDLLSFSTSLSPTHSTHFYIILKSLFLKDAETSNASGIAKSHSIFNFIFSVLQTL